MGSPSTITCAIDAVASSIQWLFNGKIVSEAMNTQQMDLEFNPVNDSIHNGVYTCRANISDVEFITNFTAMVNGELLYAQIGNAQSFHTCFYMYICHVLL